jgi:hypothetical protein
MVAGVKFQVSANTWQNVKSDNPRFISFVILTPDTRNLAPVLLKEKIDKLKPYFTDIFETRY